MVIMVDAVGIVFLYNIVGSVLLDFAPDLISERFQKTITKDFH